MKILLKLSLPNNLETKKIEKQSLIIPEIMRGGNENRFFKIL